MQETDFSKRLRACLSRFNLIVDKIETGETKRGVPDLHIFSERKGTYWVELKVCNNKEKLTIDLRSDQAVWLERYARLGGRAYIAVYMNGLIYLFQGRHAVTIMTEGIAPVYATLNSIQALAEFLEN